MNSKLSRSLLAISMLALTPLHAKHEKTKSSLLSDATTMSGKQYSVTEWTALTTGMLQGPLRGMARALEHYKVGNTKITDGMHIAADTNNLLNAITILANRDTRSLPYYKLASASLDMGDLVRRIDKLAAGGKLEQTIAGIIPPNIADMLNDKVDLLEPAYEYVDAQKIDITLHIMHAYLLPVCEGLASYVGAHQSLEWEAQRANVAHGLELLTKLLAKCVESRRYPKWLIAWSVCSLANIVGVVYEGVWHTFDADGSVPMRFKHALRDIADGSGLKHLRYMGKHGQLDALALHNTGWLPLCAGLDYIIVDEKLNTQQKIMALEFMVARDPHAVNRPVKFDSRGNVVMPLATAVIHAFKTGDTALVEWLLNHGACPNLDDFGIHGLTLKNMQKTGFIRDANLFQGLFEYDMQSILHSTEEGTRILAQWESTREKLATLLKARNAKQKDELDGMLEAHVDNVLYDPDKPAQERKNATQALCKLVAEHVVPITNDQLLDAAVRYADEHDTSLLELLLERGLNKQLAPQLLETAIEGKKVKHVKLLVTHGWPVNKIKNSWPSSDQSMLDLAQALSGTSSEEKARKAAIIAALGSKAKTYDTLEKLFNDTVGKINGHGTPQEQINGLLDQAAAHVRDGYLVYHDFTERAFKAALHFKHEGLVRTLCQHAPECIDIRALVEAVSHAYDAEEKTKARNFATVVLESDAPLNLNQNDIFIECCTAGEVELVRLMLERGVSLHKEILSVMYEHCKHNAKAVTALLREHGANQPTNIPEKALCQAAANGNKDVVELLLESGLVDINGKHGQYNGTALHEAARTGHKEVVELLLARGIDKTLQDKDKYTAEKDATTLTNDTHHQAIAQLIRDWK
ncbi:MAG: ankyrin repeat domain-containing protein [Epsilonproteobacteria bacterium]|nr:ankyrin repeat domain-containing protein [Campylobacterota bacterium]